MHKSRLAALVIDCRADDLTASTSFWSAALGYGVATGEDTGSGRYAILNVPDSQAKVLLQRVAHDSRIHLDIETDNIPAEVARLEKLGAKRVEDFPRWVVMEAPSGHRFCVVNPQRPDFAENATAWPPS